MSNSLKKLTVSIIAVIAAIMLAFGALTMGRVFAETAEGLVMDEGAYVRLEKDSSGIRFQAEIKDYDESKEYGMLIAPKWLIDSCETTDYITELEELNPGKELAICGVVKEENGKHVITGALANLRYDNLNLVWTGIAFEKTTTEEGVSYKYATVNKAGDNERSIVSVASGALNAGTETDADNIEILNTFINRAANKMNGVAEANKDDKANISVTFPELDDLMKAGKSAEAKATIIPAIDVQVKYVSNDENVVKIDESGKIIAVGAGSATIAASVAEFSDEKQLTVYEYDSCGVFVLTFLMTFPFINPQKKNLESNLPTRIEITDGIIIKDGNGESNYAEREICFVKKVVDEGDWYNIIFYFPHKLSCCICQKDLIVKGTIEEFEEIFEGKIERKIIKTK